MNQRRLLCIEVASRLRGLGVEAMLCAALLSATTVQAQTGASTTAQAQRNIVTSTLDMARGVFALAGDLKIDPALRTSLEALAQEHVSRLEPVIRSWVEDAYRTTSTPSPARRVRERFDNELSLHTVDSPGPEYDLVMAAAYHHVAACQTMTGRSFFARRALFIQQVPPAQRKIALDGERVLLERWGVPRTDLPARPVPSLVEREDALIAGIESGTADPDPALPPNLAHTLFNERKRDLSDGQQCSLHEWGFAQALASGRSPADALRDFRYALVRAIRFAGPPPLPADTKEPAPGDYPRLAAFHGVEGTVTVQFRRNAAGQLGRPAIIERVITVPGVPGRPVLFETLLDEATLVRAAERARGASSAPASSETDGPADLRLEAGMRHASRSLVRASRLIAAMLALSATIVFQSVSRAADGTSADLADSVATASWWGDFDELERLYAKAKSDTQPSSTGLPQIDRFRIAFARMFRPGDSKTRSEAFYSQLDSLTRQWATAHPASTLAQAAYLRALYAHAWFVRGDGFSSTVSPQAKEQFQRYLQMALEHLAKTEKIALTDTTTHYYLVMITRSMGQPFDTQWAVLQDALHRNPAEEGLYWELVWSTLPKWGGNAEQLERLAREAASHAAEGRRREMYARIYMTAGFEYGAGLFKETQADWAKIKPGLVDMVTRFPDPENVNRMGYIACLAQDKQTTAEDIERAGDKPLLAEWYSTYASCKRWSQSP